MSNAQTDINTYWRDKCDICKKKYSDLYLKCKENTYKCNADIDVYSERRGINIKISEV